MATVPPASQQIRQGVATSVSTNVCSFFWFLLSSHRMQRRTRSGHSGCSRSACNGSRPRQRRRRMPKMARGRKSAGARCTSLHVILDWSRGHVGLCTLALLKRSTYWNQCVLLALLIAVRPVLLRWCSLRGNHVLQGKAPKVEQKRPGKRQRAALKESSGEGAGAAASQQQQQQQRPAKKRKLKFCASEGAATAPSQQQKPALQPGKKRRVKPNAGQGAGAKASQPQIGSKQPAKEPRQLKRSAGEAA